MTIKIEKFDATTKPDAGMASAPASAGSFMAPGQQTEAVGQTLGAIGEKMTQAQAFQQKTDGVNKSRALLNDLIAQAKADNNPENHDKYIAKIPGVQSEASKGMSLRAARTEFGAEFGTMANAAMMDIQQDKREKIVNAGQASIFTGLHSLSDEYVQESDPVKQKQAFDKINLLIDNGVSHGFIQPLEGAKMKEANTKQIAVEKFDYDLQRAKTPEEVSAMIKDLQNGFYEQSGAKIDPEKKKAMLDNADHKVTFLENQRQKSAEINMSNLTHTDNLKALYGQLSAVELEEQFYANPPLIKKSTFDELQDSVTGVGHTAETTDPTYLSVIQKLGDPKYTPEEKGSFIIKSNHNGFLSIIDAQKLYQMHLIPTDNGNASLEDMLGKQQAGDDFQKMMADHATAQKGISDKNAILKAATQKINSFFTGPNKTSDTVAAMKTLYDNIVQKKLPNEEIISEADRITAQANVKANPNVFSRADEKGSDGHDRFGPVKIYKDGRVVRKR